MYDIVIIFTAVIISLFLTFEKAVAISFFLAIFSFYTGLEKCNISENFTYAKLFNLFFPPLAIVLTAYFISFLFTKKRNQINLLNNENEQFEKELTSLKEKYKQVDETRIVLEKKFLRDEDFSLKLYEAISRLATLNYNEIKAELLKITNEFINAKAVAFYDYTEKKFLLKTKFPTNFSCVKLIDNFDEIFEVLLNSDKVLTVRDKLKDNKHRILLSSLLRKKDKEPIGAILVYDIDFIDLNSANVRLFNMICNWGSIEIEKVLQLAIYESEHIKFGREDIFNYMYFTKIINAEYYKVKRYNTKFSVLLLKILNKEQMVQNRLNLIIEIIGKELKKHLRTCDLIFYNDVKQDTFILILPETDFKGAQTVRRMLMAHVKDADIFPYYEKDKIINIEIEIFYVDKDTTDEEFDNLLISMVV